MKAILRPYQEKAIDEICNGFKAQNKQLCVLPTGSGKTVIFSNIISRLNCKTLIIAHTHEILDQIKSTLSKECPDVDVKYFDRRRKGQGKVTICSIQAAIRNIQRLSSFDYDLLIIDECHRSCAKSYRKLIDECGFTTKRLLGVTATPFRTDQQSVYEIFGFPTYTMSLIDMIEEGYLVDYIGYRVKTNIRIDKVRKRKGDFVGTQLAPVINVKNRNELIVDQYLKLGNNEKTIAFCVSIAHAKDLKKFFLDKGVSCDSIDGKMSPTQRKSVLDKLKVGEIKVVTNCNLLTEGFDEPSVSVLLMCRPTISKSLYIQMIGRGSRLFPGKENCKVIEFTDNDYDVECLEYIVNSSQKKIPIRDGESLKAYTKRLSKELLDAEGDAVVEIIKPVKKTAYSNRLASPWQIETLKKNNIKFPEPLLEITANFLLYKLDVNLQPILTQPRILNGNY